MTALSHRTSTGLAIALALGAITASGAQARSPLQPAAGAVTASQRVAVRVVRVADHSGFVWGDAVIGAGAMAGLIGIGAGVTLASGGLRSRRSHPRATRVG